MRPPVVVVGMGEIGGLFARGLLKRGHPLFPILRGDDIEREAGAIPDPAMVLVAVGENDLHPALQRLPERWRHRLALLQNELLPRDWEAHGVVNPTVIAVWFEKKRGQEAKVLLPSPLFGPHAPLLAEALATLDIPTWRVESEGQLVFELVRKNLYILTTNIAGLVTGGNVEALWRDHRPLALEVANEVLTIQLRLAGREFDTQRLIDGMVEGFEGDPQHQCKGRSAPGRLTRALAHADALGIEVPRLRAIAADGPRT